MEIVSKIRWADYTAGTAGPRGRSDWLGDRSGRSRSWIYPWKPGDWQMLLPPPPLSSCSPSARTRPSLSTVRAPLVCHPPSSPWLEKPLPLPPDSVDPAAPPRLLAPSPPPSPIGPSAPPGSLVPPAPPWSGVNPPTPLDSSLLAVPRRSGSFALLSSRQLHLGPGRWNCNHLTETSRLSTEVNTSSGASSDEKGWRKSTCKFTAVI